MQPLRPNRDTLKWGTLKNYYFLLMLYIKYFKRTSLNYTVCFTWCCGIPPCGQGRYCSKAYLVFRLKLLIIFFYFCLPVYTRMFVCMMVALQYRLFTCFTNGLKVNIDFMFVYIIYVSVNKYGCGVGFKLIIHLFVYPFTHLSIHPPLHSFIIKFNCI